MKKFTWILMILLTLGQLALAETTRPQKLERVKKALGRWQQSGQVWQGYLESSNVQADIYVQYPGKLRVNYLGGNNWVTSGSQYKREEFPTGDEFGKYPIWNLFGGQIGKNVEIMMLDSATYERFGRSVDVVVCDLLGDSGGRHKLRLRILVSEEGEPRLLGWEESGRPIWLRDFRSIQAPENLFSAPKI